MHAAVVTLNLKGMAHEEFAKVCGQFCPAFEQIPGLVTKVWISDPKKNTYGGLYTFRDRAAFEAYQKSDLWRQVQAFPNFANITVQNFDVLDEWTRRTTNLIAVAV